VNLTSTGYLLDAFCHPHIAPGGKLAARFGVDSGPAARLDSNPGLVFRLARKFPKTMKSSILSFLLGCTCLVSPSAYAQVNSGSDGHDGAFNPTQNVTLDMADHPDGIYQYTSVNIPLGVTVNFAPNAANKPVVWLVQGTCVISGVVDISGKAFEYPNSGIGGLSGPGGGRGGHGGTSPANGLGPGGGNAPQTVSQTGGYASYATKGDEAPYYGNPGNIYGNSYILPLTGGSGGAGSFNGYGGLGGGGAILIASTDIIQINGSIKSTGGSGASNVASGSGGAIRLVAKTVTGSGVLSTAGGMSAGLGRVRIDAMENLFSGTITGVFTEGFQPIIIPAGGQGVQLSIGSIAGTAVSQNPSGVLANPDVIIPSQQSNPLPVVVNCSNIPLNTEITVIVHPTNGPDVQAVAMNNAGALAASTATVSLNMPRGGGIIYAKCVSGVANLGVDTSSKELRTKSLAETGWTADGERFAKMEFAAALGGSQQITYISESGKRYPLAIR